MEFIIQILNVGGIKYGDTWLILPTVKFISMPIPPAIWYRILLPNIIATKISSYLLNEN